MKKLFWICAILMTALSLHAGIWMHDYDDALEKAQKVHKPILMMYSTKI